MNNGKELCYMMKKFRAELAERNGIEGFEFKECDFEGECKGYCPACDEEAMKLKELIDEKSKITTDEGKVSKDTKTDDSCIKRPSLKNGRLRGKVISEPMPIIQEEGLIIGPKDNEKENIADRTLGDIRSFEMGSISETSLLETIKLPGPLIDKKKPRGINGLFGKKDKK